MHNEKYRHQSYNTEKYLLRCLSSIIKKKYKNLGIICVDGGFTGYSGQILDKLVKRYSRIKVYHIENSGVSVTRNKKQGIICNFRT